MTILDWVFCFDVFPYLPVSPLGSNLSVREEQLLPFILQVVGTQGSDGWFDLRKLYSQADISLIIYKIFIMLLKSGAMALV